MWKRLHRSIKKFWDEQVRPYAEPLLKMLVKDKVIKEISRHKD